MSLAVLIGANQLMGIIIIELLPIGYWSVTEMFLDHQISVLEWLTRVMAAENSALLSQDLITFDKYYNFKCILNYSNISQYYCSDFTVFLVK